MAGAGAIAAGAASGGAGGAISGGATAWKNGGDAGDIARAALIHGLGGALGGGIAGRFGVSAATMGAGRALFAEVTGNVAGELAAQSVSVAFGQSSGVDWRSVAVSAAVGAAPSAWRVAAGVGAGWRLPQAFAVDHEALGRQGLGRIFEESVDEAGGGARGGGGIGPEAVAAPVPVTRTTSDNAAELGRNMGREGRHVDPGQAAGHIVPSTGSKGHWAAGARARALLAAFDIGVNDAANGVPIGHPRPHNEMHTRAFLQSVEFRLANKVATMRAEGIGRRAIRSALRRELRSIGREVLQR
jgi:hypothetical protein